MPEPLIFRRRQNPPIGWRLHRRHAERPLSCRADHRFSRCGRAGRLPGPTATAPGKPSHGWRPSVRDRSASEISEAACCSVRIRRPPAPATDRREYLPRARSRSTAGHNFRRPRSAIALPGTAASGSSSPDGSPGCARRRYSRHGKHLQSIDEAAAGLDAALELEADETAIAAFEIGVGPALHLTGHLVWVDDPRHFGMLGEEFRNGRRVGAMGSHAQRQGLQPLDEQEGVERAHWRAEITQQGHAHFEDIRDRAQGLGRLCPDRAVIARIRLV